MIVTICAVCILAKLKHYKLKWFFYSWSCFPVLLMQCILIFLQISVLGGTYYFVKFAALIERAVIISFLFPLLEYHLYKPATIGAFSIVSGTFLNKFVMAQNGGKMPVFPSLSYLTGYVKPHAFDSVDSLHILGSETTKFKFLADYIDLGYSILSPGDVLIHLFTFFMLYASIKAANMCYGTIEKSIS